ncbi:TonB-dependent receptor [Sphingomonas histidinilytica]|uniref:Iron complex outermembrane recepter protein n=1 Tax=Rhizorhabdus histidinilytica TaxID=439228 RepID=A0A1T5EM29_9SPHN|nr:TonB-dependent receptor [Rhizorhabdus histidinilytica]MBO9376735.1 TonB-dependent receptor [Rhizorhabdus histidinilytica]SKB85034.1 iron complex outermembrane recepter protein [Rhizorhabdus histidinilytica]
MKRHIQSGLLVSGALLALLAAPAAAAETGGEGDGDIVVTAQKRAEPLQKVPLAITAVTSTQLDRSGITDLAGVVASVPNLNLGPQLGVAKIALRGIGLENLSPGAEGSIAFHMDGVFVSRSIAALASFYDIEQVEVLRGPQGTLYGRNATGGSINLTTRAPTREVSGYLRGTVGNYGRTLAEGAVSGPIAGEGVLARVAFQAEHRDGYGRNLFTGKPIDDLKSFAARGKLLFDLGDRGELELTGDYYRRNDSSGSYHYAGAAGETAPGVPYQPFGLVYGGTVASGPRDIDTDVSPSNRARFWGGLAKLSYDLGGGIEFRSLTAYRNTRYTTLTDLDSTSAPLASITQLERDEQISQELQLSGQTSRLTWLVGAYYFHEKDYGAQVIPFNNFLVGFPFPGTDVQGAFFGGTIKTDAYALFGQSSYEVVDDVRLTVGARYSHERKRDEDLFLFDFTTPYDPTVPLPLASRRDKASFDSFTPRLGLDWQVTPELLLYASWSKGFKAGTYNLGQFQNPVDPEKVDAFEGGIKSTLFDRRLRINLAGFHYTYKDLQIGKIAGQVLALENAATATIYGLEAELTANPFPGFEINASGSWLHARFDDYVSGDPARTFGDGTTVDPDTGLPAFDLSGNRLSQSPDFTAFVGAQYSMPTTVGDFTLRGELAWRDRVYFTPFNRSIVSQAANSKINLFLNWTSGDEHWSGSLFVKNLTDKTVVGNSYVSSPLLGSPVQAYYEDPRTYGLTLGYKF